MNRAVTAKAKAEPVDVFVMGPGKRNTSAADATRLRRELIQRCKDEGHSAYAEHKDIRTQVAALGPNTDLCTLEVLYAEQVDILVFIPSSHGAAAEIGYFAALSDPDKAKSMARSLVLLDRSFRRKKGFVVDGPVRILKTNGALIKWVDLTNHDAAWRHLKRLIDDTRRWKVRKRALQGD